MRALAGIALVLSAVTAHAKPLATLDQDLDGDGAVDHADVDDHGVLHVTSHSGALVVPLGTVTHATLAAGRAGGKPMLVVELDQEAVLFEYATPSWKQVGRVPIGGVGLDQDYGLAIDARPDGIYRYQTRPGFERCDGAPAYLFAEGWNGTKFQRLAKIPTGVPDNAPILTARGDLGAADLPLLIQARFASHEPGAEDATALGAPTELDDGKPATLWREDFAASAGEGQFFTYAPFVPTAKAVELKLMAAPRTFNRPRRLGIVTAHGAWHVDFPDAANDPPNTEYVVHLPEIDGCMTIVIESTYGPARGTTAIAELEVLAAGERGGRGAEMLVDMIASGALIAPMTTLARAGVGAVVAIDNALTRSKDAVTRARLVRALLGLHAPALAPTIGPILGRVIAAGWIHDRDLADAIGALGVLGRPQELVAVIESDAPIEAKVAAVHALAGSSSDQLVELAGKGPRELRHAVIELLAGLEMATLARVVARTDLSAAAVGDLCRAITRRARAKPAERELGVSAILAATATETDYERRYRLVDALATLGDAAALDRLGKLLGSLPAGAERAAFSQVAARAFAIAPRPEALALVLELARDADPGVRIAAITALASAEGGPAGPWHHADGPDAIDRAIITPLGSDVWPEVRRHAAQMLGERCIRSGPAHALAASIGRDPELDVRGDALAALVQCKAVGAADVLAHVWNDTKLPSELRQRAVDLSVALGDRVLAQKLVALFATWRGRALDSAEALALAQSAAYALGRLAPPGAADALLAALDDAAFPEIAAAAASSLGLLGPACPASAKAKLKTLAHSDEPQVQVAAAHAAAQCGH